MAASAKEKRPFEEVMSTHNNIIVLSTTEILLNLVDLAT
jgi:hypothetical protein